MLVPGFELMLPDHFVVVRGGGGGGGGTLSGHETNKEALVKLCGTRQ